MIQRLSRIPRWKALLCGWFPIIVLLVTGFILQQNSDTSVAAAAAYYLPTTVNSTSTTIVLRKNYYGKNHGNRRPSLRARRNLDFFSMFDDSRAIPEKGFAKLEWQHCGIKNDAIILTNIHMVPNPIQVPGKVFISFDMEVKENLSAPIKLKVDMKKKIPMPFGLHTWFSVPCYENGLGSCIIEDVCDTDKINFGKCPIEFEAQDISCKCPILQGSYTFPPIEQEVPEPPSDIDPVLMEGEFKVKFSLYKGYKRLTCYETNAIINL